MSFNQYMLAAIYITGFICFAVLYPTALKLAILKGETIPKKHWIISWLTWSFIWPFLLIYFIIGGLASIVLGVDRG